MAAALRTLIDTKSNLNSEDFHLTAADFGRANHPFFIRQQRLRGGLQEGVDTVTLDNGRFRVVVLPTRGMGLWKAWLGETPIGWHSPVRGPVHPQFVPIAEPGGLGWLAGFDEWLVRCGLESNGAPEFDAAGRLRYPLHGRIANRPVSRLELSVDPDAGEIRLTGTLDETRFLFTNLQLRSTVLMRLDEPGLTVIDEVTNLAGTPGEMQLLYHINFGPPLLDAGARVVAPVKSLSPRDNRSADGLAGWDQFAAAQPGYAEQTYLADLWADNQQRTSVLLKSGAGNLAASVGFNKSQLPCFTLWKNTAALEDGYVTGLEPATNFPNPRSFEAERGRVVKLKPGETARFEVNLTMHDTPATIAAAEAAVLALGRGSKPELFAAPQRDWTVAAH